LKENGDEEIAICAGGTTVEQIECLPNPPRIFGFDKNNCAGYVSVSALLPGELPLSCAPVEYETQTDAKYCWYYENQVCDYASQEPMIHSGVSGAATPGLTAPSDRRPRSAASTSQ
jgi:hypothetical protein